MDRLRRVAGMWNWLPAFRAVGETCHLPTAGRALGLTPPALSRTVKLLEEEIGVPLFRRRGRGLVLTDDGLALLHAVRDAMRRIDDGIAVVKDRRFAGAFAVSASGVIALTWLIPGLRSVTAAHPGLRPNVVSVPVDRVVEELLQGRIDVAFQSVGGLHEDLAIARLGAEPNGLYAGPDHALLESTRVGRADLAAWPFAVTTRDPPDVPDVWPDGEPRVVGVVMERLPLLVEAVATGGYLAVLPDAIAARSRTALRRLEVEDLHLPDTPVFALHRRPIGDPGPAEETVRAVREAWRASTSAQAPDAMS